MTSSFKELENTTAADLGIFADVNINKLVAEDFSKESIYLNANNLLTDFEQQNYFIRLEKRAKVLKVDKDFKKYMKAIKNQIIKPAFGSSFRENVTCFSNQPIALKCGKWICSDKGIDMPLPNGGLKQISAVPITISQSIINEDEGKQKIELAYKKKKSWKKIIVPNELIPNRVKFIEFLKGNGINVTSTNAPFLEDYINDLQNINEDTLPEVKSTGRVGWLSDGSFAPYDKNYIFDGDEASHSYYSTIKKGGDFKTWKDEIRRLRVNKQMKILTSTSLASALLKFTGGKNFLLHIWGQSSCGKSLALRIAQSFWGLYESSDSSMEATKVFHERACCLWKNLPYISDEIQILKEKKGYDAIFDAWIMSITEGKSKGRGTKTSIEKSKTWQNVIITSGEGPIVDVNSNAGTLNRVVELEVGNDFIYDILRGNEIGNIFENNYGFAGEMFVRKVQELLKIDKDYIRNEYSKIKSEVIKKLNPTGKQADNVSVILLGDKIAHEAGIFDDAPLAIEDFRGIALTQEQVLRSYRIEEQLLDWVVSNSRNFITSKTNILNDTDFARVITSQKIYGKIEDEFVYLADSGLKEAEKELRFDFNAIKKDFVNREILIVDSDGHFKTKTRLNGIQTRCIKLKIIPSEKK